MSLPQTPEDIARYYKTLEVSDLTENVVSTACPECGTRFVILARYGLMDCRSQPVWQLRCTACPYRGTGELKKT